VREGVFEFISVDDFDPAELRSAVTRADEKKVSDTTQRAA
jgi:acyl-CoA dehydrogenase